MNSFSGARNALDNARLATIITSLDSLVDGQTEVDLAATSPALLLLMEILLELRKIRSFYELEYGYQLDDPGD